jgi:hypothetical protein
MLMTKRNPKQEGSNVFDCKPQCGPCPMGCNQCFYNRPGASYVPLDEPHMPTVAEVGDGIMRVNALHDSNIERDKVIAATAQYPRRFFNTAIPKFNFPGPVVFTANREEEKAAVVPCSLQTGIPYNLMFVRLRVSATNIGLVAVAVEAWTKRGTPVVLTFMAYYDGKPPSNPDIEAELSGPLYEWKQRHVNSYHCPTREFMTYVLRYMKPIAWRLVTMCGTLQSNFCKDCRNCETYYWQTMKHMAEVGA